LGFVTLGLVRQVFGFVALGLVRHLVEVDALGLVRQLVGFVALGLVRQVVVSGTSVEISSTEVIGRGGVMKRVHRRGKLCQ
jgi:hypothetical protein